MVTTLQGKLQRAVHRHIDREQTVCDLRPLTGGAASATWQFDTTSNTDTRELILRTAPGGATVATGLDKTTEAQVQSAAVDAGVPAARVVFVLDQDDELGSGYVMERLPGESIPRKILRDERFGSARQVMTAQCGEILARIHAMDLNALPPLPDLSAPAQLSRYEEIYRSLVEPLPTFELAFRWLDKHCPPTLPPRLVHGDFRNGNFLVDPSSGITTVLDWELAHLGDPLEDLGWLCVNSWRFGHSEQAVGGFGQREALFAAYENAGGGAVDPRRVRFWELFGVLKWGIFCLYMSAADPAGNARSVERAAIGRRVSETEIDLLQLLNDRAES